VIHGSTSVAMESASHPDGFVMKLMTVETALMNFLLPAVSLSQMS